MGKSVIQCIYEISEDEWLVFRFGGGWRGGGAAGGGGAERPGGR